MPQPPPQPDLSGFSRARGYLFFMRSRSNKQKNNARLHRVSITSPFPVSRNACRQYGLKPPVYKLGASPSASGPDGARLLSRRINDVRKSFSPSQPAVGAGDVGAIGLIENIWRYLSESYRKHKNPFMLKQAGKSVRRTVSSRVYHKVLLKFAGDFPSREVYQRKIPPSVYLRSGTAGIPNREVVCRELLMLYLSNRNPAFKHLVELFSDSNLKKETEYTRVIKLLREFFRSQPFFGPENLPLVDFLLAPVRAAPDSLAGQLDYINKHWSHLLPPGLKKQLLLSLDIIREEKKVRGGGAPPVVEPDFRQAGKFAHLGPEYDFDYYPEYERFSPDLDWMPRVVIMVKNILVWLDQLSRRYRRPIGRLDQIPDEELDRLARWGFTGLWLIGLWERSRASKKIKHGCGNPEAAASAYSIYDYVIASELGGEEAFYNLKERAIRRGIRMACDMVPNHTAIDSKWVIEHPQWFMQISRPPFPVYEFGGPDLSEDSRVGIFIEDHYWDRSDAAVVFKRLDRMSGDERYIYHGNDGTNMPWNDTAQLDFVRSEVRENVIRTILRVARMFPIIRFDAAMVLTKRHFQRLWYPPPGSGGDIPSRAGEEMVPAEFNRRFRGEFWRELVDRVAAEVPDTLLLAEAFWLLEGYFVRTLGMNRVYNSAFMNMLKMEMNAGYRRVLKNILEFTPRILKRLVNFLSNPDEATAAASFGRGDKYFGICTMMVTLPGLPLFGHGQVEGLAERYGMEYRKAYRREPIDKMLVKRHEREIFPLMKKRHLFSDIKHFYLYDFFLENGTVNEDVFAYSNRYENERALIVYHNRFSETTGWIKDSAARLVKERQGETKLERVDLARGLALRTEDKNFCIFKDRPTGLEYIRSSREIRDKGLHLKLSAYQAHVFTDFREVRDSRNRFLAQLAKSLGGRGTLDINKELKRIHFASLHRSFREVFKAEIIRRALDLGEECSSLPELEKGLNRLLHPGLKRLFSEVSKLRRRKEDFSFRIERQIQSAAAIVQLIDPRLSPSWISSRYSRPALRHLRAGIPSPRGGGVTFFRVVFIWSIIREVSGAVAYRHDTGTAWLVRWFLDELFLEILSSLGCDENSARREFDLIMILVRYTNLMEKLKTKNHLHRLGPVFRDSMVRRYLHFNWFADVLWFNKENFDRMVYWLCASSTISRAVAARKEGEPFRVRGLVRYRAALKLKELAESSGYRVKEFRDLLARQKIQKGKNDGFRTSRRKIGEGKTPCRD